MQPNNITVRRARRGDGNKSMYSAIEVCCNYVTIEGGHFSAEAKEVYDPEYVGIGGRKGAFGVEHNDIELITTINKIRKEFGNLPAFVENLHQIGDVNEVDFFDASEKDKFLSQKRRLTKS